MLIAVISDAGASSGTVGPSSGTLALPYGGPTLISKHF
jgi:hypothetical protein